MQYIRGILICMGLFVPTMIGGAVVWVEFLLTLIGGVWDIGWGSLVS